MDAYEAVLAATGRAVDEIAPHDALKATWEFVRRTNAYVEEVAPWVLARDAERRRRLEVVLYRLADALRLIAMLVSPAVPRAAAELWARLGLEGSPEGRNYVEDGRWDGLSAGAHVHSGSPLFPRLEEDAATA
jgi:methionyl-tRNA synthetase